MRCKSNKKHIPMYFKFMRVFAGIIMKLHNTQWSQNLYILVPLCNNKSNKHFQIWILLFSPLSNVHLFYQILKAKHHLLDSAIWLLKILMTLENNLATLCDILSGFLFSRHFLRFINEKGLAHFKGFDKGVTLFLHILVHILF